MHTEAIKSAYRRYARIYDTLFGPALHPGRRLIVDALECRPGDRILEVGVGTGLSLPLYPEYVRVTGIDISREMLEKARRRVASKGLSQVEALVEMDAEAMTFPDASFDKVVAMYVVSVVRRPARLFEEIHRVCRPGGDVFFVNHFRSSNRFVGAMEKALAGFSSQLGFHPDFELQALLGASPMELAQVSRINLFWKILRFRNGAGSAAPQASPTRALAESDRARTASSANPNRM
jgi:phosphatidylethanolamine/phosphatidyl-N-methylethanolamine N-methyltransferase